MRIAWRYNNLEKIDPEQGSANQIDGKSNYYFDLSQQIAQEMLEKLDVTTFIDDTTATKDDNQLFYNKIYASLLASLKTKMDDNKFESTNNNANKNLLRIAIQSLGSPLWWNDHFSTDLCVFLTLLKSLVRHSLAVCFITMPTHLFKHFVSSHIVYGVSASTNYFRLFLCNFNHRTTN